MRGSVVKRTDSKGRTCYFVIIEERDAAGKRRRRWRSDPSTGSGFTSRRAADMYAATLVTSINDGTYVEPNRDTLGAWLDVWLAIIQPTVRPSTWASYEKNVRLHIKPYLGVVDLRRLNAADLDRLYQRLLDSGRLDHRAGVGLSARTVRYVATILGKALKDAVRKGHIVRSPALDADPPKPANGAAAMRTWTADELGTFLDGTTEHRWAPVFAFLAMTGARRGEALGLRWRDLDLDGGRAAIMQTVQKIAGATVVGTTKTAAGRRVVALDAGLIALLRTHRREQAELRLLVGAGWRDNGLVFPDHTGAPAAPEGVSRAFRRAVTDLGLPPIRLHDLRHTWATLALQAKVHPKVVQERLGHANIAVTLGTYSHVAPSLHDEAAETVAALVTRKAVDGR
jgi:integrase